MRTNNLGTKKYNQAGYTHTKVYNNETTLKGTLLLESLKKKKPCCTSRLKNQKNMNNAIAEKCFLHINHTCHLYAH